MATQSSKSATTHVSLQDWGILILLSIVWGSSFILIKKGLIAFEPVEMALLRLMITSVCFVPIFFFMGKGAVPSNKLGWMAAVGILGSALPGFLFAFAETQIASSVAGILNSLTPIFTWTLGLVFFAVVYTRNHLMGVLMGFLGAMVVVVFEPNFTLNVNPYALLVVIGTVSYALSGNIVKTHLQDVHPITLSSIAFFFVGIPSFVYAFNTDIFATIASHPKAWLSLGAIAILALLGTTIANILFYRLIQRTNAVFASSVAFIIPLMALVWGVLDGELLQWTHLAGMVFILAGVWLLRRK